MVCHHEVHSVCFNGCVLIRRCLQRTLMIVSVGHQIQFASRYGLRPEQRLESAI